jgi:hypothetical protein
MERHIEIDAYIYGKMPFPFTNMLGIYLPLRWKEIIMGKVRISEYSVEKEIQVTWEFIYDYIYCDECGSFDIGITSIIPKKIVKYIDWLFIILLLIITIIVGIYSHNYYYVCLSGLITILVFAYYKFRTSTIVCNKCGNTKISSLNSRNYLENDKSNFDIPENKTTRKHITTREANL